MWQKFYIPANRLLMLIALLEKVNLMMGILAHLL